MDRNALENALRSSEAMRQQFPEGSPEWQACVDKEIEIRRRLSMPPPAKEELRGAEGGPSDVTGAVDRGYFDDRDNPARGDPGYQESLGGIDPGYLDNRGSVDGPPGYFRHVNVGGGGQPSAPPPPPPPGREGRQATTEASAPTQPPNLAAPEPDPQQESDPQRKRFPLRLNFDSPTQAIAWGVTGLTFVIGGYQLYKKHKEGR